MNKDKVILYHAISVLNEDFSASIEKIANAAQVNKRTLYRYYKDRDTLISACYANMLDTWYEAMLAAYNGDAHPIKQLEQMLYAAIDCGVKYLFLSAVESKDGNNDIHRTEKFIAYEKARDKWFGIIPELQEKNVIDRQLSGPWIRLLFVNTVRTSVQALKAGDVAQNDLKRLAWLCFSRSIGITG